MEVKSTYERFENGEQQITGLPRLAEELASAKAPGRAKNIEVRLREWLGVEHDEQSAAAGGADFGEHIFWGDGILKIPAAPIEYAAKPIFQMGAIIGIYAEKAVGKTFFALEAALSIAIGRRFLKWDVPCPRRVLYVDGEMPAAEMQERLRCMTSNIPSTLGLLSADYLRSLDCNVNIGDRATREQISAALQQYEKDGIKIEVLFLDNLVKSVGKARSTVQAHLKILRDKGLLSKKGLTLTSAGDAILKQHQVAS